MIKPLSVLAVLGIIAVAGNQAASAAFSWSNLNPMNWFGNGRCNKCETPKQNCGCPVKDPCPTGAAAPCSPCIKQKPCDPCKKSIPQSQPCDACDRLQHEMQNK